MLIRQDYFWPGKPQGQIPARVNPGGPMIPAPDAATTMPREVQTPWSHPGVNPFVNRPPFPAAFVYHSSPIDNFAALRSAVTRRPGAAHTISASQLSIVGKPGGAPAAFAPAPQHIAGAVSHRLQAVSQTSVPAAGGFSGSGKSVVSSVASKDMTASPAVGISLVALIGLAIVMLV